MAVRRTRRRCIDCLPTSQRVAKYPGPRCATHHREVRSARSQARKAVHVENNYGISEEDYQAILKAQGGACFICHKKPGRKRLSVDHDHKMGCGHPPKQGCRNCVRGLLHSKCNSYLGWIHDDPAAMERGADYLRNPPARRVLSRGEV